MKKIFFEESYAIQGAVFDVYREMGCGFLEAVYQECLERELELRGIPFVSQPTIQLSYKGTLLNQRYKPDLICFNKIIVELKAVTSTTPKHLAQVMNYLNTTNMKLGLIINFGHHPKAEIKRVVV